MLEPEQQFSVWAQAGHDFPSPPTSHSVSSSTFLKDRGLKKPKTFTMHFHNTFTV